MPATKNVDPGQSPLHFFGSELRHYRKRAELTQEQLGERINYSGDLFSKIETGLSAPSSDFAQLCDAELDTGGALSRLLVMVRWMAFPPWMRPWVDAEREAHTLRSWEPLVVPGLLQTEDYARELLRAEPGATIERVEELLAGRLGRQAILERESPTLLWVTLAESVLRYEIGDPEVMHGQLKALVEAAAHPTVTIQVVPASAGAHPGVNGAFAIASFDGSPDVVYLENTRGGQVTDQPEDVQATMNDWEAIRAGALPARESLDLIARVMEQWT